VWCGVQINDFYSWYTWGPELSPRPDQRIDTCSIFGASLTQARIGQSGTWQIWLTLASGDPGLIVWNPTQTVPFTIPGEIHARTMRDIFGGVNPVHGTTVAVTNSPILLSSCCQAPPVVNAVTNAASYSN